MMPAATAPATPNAGAGATAPADTAARANATATAPGGASGGRPATGVPFPAYSGKRTPESAPLQLAFLFRAIPVNERQNRRPGSGRRP
jgi:hypothetical protein